MERFFQADFAGVRIHEGPTAQAMGALAFTLGEQIHFAPGLYDPSTHDGVALLGHELTHVVQQRDGRVVNPYGQGVTIVQDPALEAEADRMGQQVAEAMWTEPGRAPSAGVAMAAHAQTPISVLARGRLVAAQPRGLRWPTRHAQAKAAPSIMFMLQDDPWGDPARVLDLKNKLQNQPPPQPPPRAPRVWTYDGLVRSIQSHWGELRAFAQRKISSATKRMYKDYLKFRTHHKPSDEMVCTLMWEKGASYSRYKWGLSGGFLSAEDKRSLGDTSKKAYSCGETNVLLSYPTADFVLAASFNAGGALPPCSRCQGVLEREGVNWFE